MLIASNSRSKLTEMKLALGKHFKVKDLGEVKFLLGIEVIREKKTALSNSHNGLISISY